MSFGGSFDAKQQVKQAVDIADLVGGYLPLRREGRGFKALCPWHDDSRPSLQVNQERQSWRCWVCNLGGDVFSFVMKIEGIEFPEALKMLADRAGISLQPAARAGGPAPGDEKRLLYQAMAWANEQYHRFLQSAPEAAAAREYLAERRITPESIQKFQLGYAPDEWSWLTDQSRGTPHSITQLERVGLVSRRKQGPGHYDRFKGRVLFPIFDAQSRAVGLGGRVLPRLAPPDAAKYYNSTETPLFSKSNLLYGLNLARDGIRRTNMALVMEGYTDCIVAHQCGVDNAVAVLGTAVGASHIQILRRYGRDAERVRVVLVLDGDEAGRKRAKEVLELFVSANVDMRVLTLPDQSDPADYLLDHGADAFAQLVAAAPDALTHAFQSATAGVDLQADVHAANAALEQLLATIAKAPRLRADTSIEDRLREEKFLQRLSADFRVPEEQARQLMTKMRRKTPLRPGAAEAEPASVPEKIEPLERELLELLLHHPAMIEELSGAIEPGQIAGQQCRKIFARCCELWAQGILPDFERLLLENDDPGVKTLLVELDESGRAKLSGEAEVRRHDVLAGFERRQRNHELRHQTATLKQQQLTKEDELAVLLEIHRQESVRQQQQEARTRLGSSDPTEG